MESQRGGGVHLPLLLKEKSLSPRLLASGILHPPALPHAWDWGAAGASAPRWDLISPVTSGGDTCFRASSCHQQGSNAAMRAVCSGLVTLKCCLCIYIDIKRLLHLKGQQRGGPWKHAANTHTHTHTQCVQSKKKPAKLKVLVLSRGCLLAKEVVIKNAHSTPVWVKA